MVNYEFTNISAFKHLRKKINKCTTINKVNLNWFINLSNRSNKNWKENHARGGGIMFNYICHSIFYLEFLFGKIISVKTKIFLNSKRKIKSAVGFIFFKKNIIAKINVQVGKLDNKYKPIHQINVITNQNASTKSTPNFLVMLFILTFYKFFCCLFLILKRNNCINVVTSVR